MQINTNDRQELLKIAEASFLDLASSANAAVDLAEFASQRYLLPPTKSNQVQRLELLSAVSEISILTTMLADIITNWKNGGERVLSQSGLEINILNELWANIQAVAYFLATYDIDLTSLEMQDADTAMDRLKMVNRLL